MRVAIVGCGNIARQHVQAIRSQRDAEIVGVADVFEEAARAFARQTGIREAFGTVTELLDEVHPDVVHVLTPPASHCGATLECLERGCHVLVEKPMALDVAEADVMIDTARRRGVILSVDHNCRFEAVVQRVEAFLASGELGRPVTVEVVFTYNVQRYPALIRPGAQNSHWAYRLNGGPLQDQMPHPASLLVSHVGEIRDVVSQSSNRGVLPEPWADEIRVLVDGQDAHAAVYISFSAKPDSLTLTIRGTEGTVFADLGTMIATVDRTSALPRAAARGLTGFRRGFQNLRGAAGNAFRAVAGKIDKTGGVAGVVEGFYEAVEKGTEAPVTMDEGRRVVELIQKIWPRPVARPAKGPAVERTRSAPGTTGGRPPTILVTGASGFIGSHLVERLVRDGASVRAFVRPNSVGLGLLRSMDVEIVQGDLSDATAVRDAMRGIRTVYHAGAATTGDRETHQRATVMGTGNIVEAATHERVDRFVHFSSLVVYRVIGVPRGSTIREDWPYEGHADDLDPYTGAKIDSEAAVFEAYRKLDLPAVVVRPGIVIGPRGWVLPAHLGFRLQDRVFILFGRGRGILPLVYVDNLVDAVIRCAETAHAIGKAYNLVDEGRVTVLDYVERFRRETGLTVRILKVPFFVPYCAAGAYEAAAGLGLLKKSATSRLQLSWKYRSLHCTISNERARTDLGWRSRVPLDEALDRTFRWYAETRR